MKASSWNAISLFAAAMEVLGMGSLDDEQCAEVLPPDVWMHDKKKGERSFVVLPPSLSIRMLICRQPFR